MRKTARIKRTRRHRTVVEGFTATYNSDESPGRPLSRGWRPGKPFGQEAAETDLSAAKPRKFVVYDPVASERGGSAAAGGQEVQPAKILCLGGTHDERVALRERCGDEVEVVEVTSPGRALALLRRGEFAGIYADADHFAEVVDLARVVQNERILQGMPDGVVMLNSENIILWGNGRLREWTGRNDIIGANFYDVMGTPEILGPDFCP